MKRIVPILLLMLTMFASIWAQNTRSVLLPAEATDYVRCYTVENDAALRASNPNMQTQEDFERWISEKIIEREQSGVDRQATYRIPYIVHVVHAGQGVGAGANLSAAKVNAQIQQINADFNRLNSDAANTPAVFLSVAGSISIEFVPAVVDPNGNLLTEPGIHRINGNTTFGISSWTTTNTETTLKPGTYWDPNRYFNIWSCNLGGGILGYAQFPEAPSLPGIGTGNGGASTDGIVIAFGTFGSLSVPGSTAPYNLGRTITHELGHWVGLRHIWGDGGCGVDDFCADTPAAGVENYSGAPCTFPGPNSCTTANDLPDMFQNYMDYSDDVCMNLFTQNQAARMVVVLENSIRRHDLLTSNVWQNPSNIVTASFTSSETGGCSPLVVSFTDESESGGSVAPINSWQWNFDVTGTGGASPASFSGQTPPAVTFSNVGTYEVELTVSNGTETNDVSSEIIVSAGGTYNHLNGAGLVNILASTEGGTSGHIGGHNSFGDIAKADYFAEGAAGLILDYVDFNFATATAPAGTNLTCAIWADNGGSPGAELATSNILISSITTGIGNLKRVEFGDLVLTGPFYAGIKLNLTNNSDVALYTNINGSTNPSTAWEQFGDNSWHNFTEPEVSWDYDVALAVYATLNCPTVVSNPPVANFSGTPTTVCSGSLVTFTDLSTNTPTSWLWNFGDGLTSTLQNPTHAYTTGGNKTVTLTATNADGSDSEVKTNYITVQAIPTGFTATANLTTICSGASVNLNMTGTFGGAYAWFVGGTQIATGMATTVSPTTTTTYRATCNNGVCAVESSITITVNPLPAIPTISVNGASLTASSTSTGTYQWNLGGTAIGGATGANYTATASGSYTVTLTTAQGCSRTSTAVNISLTPPVANFSGTPTTVCAGNSVSFTDLTTNSPTSWAWNFGDGTTSTVQNPTHTYSTSGAKTVTLIATNAFGSDTEVKTNYITVQALPTGFTATANLTTICSGASVNLNMTGTFGGAYAWFVGGTQIATGMATTVSPTSTTTYRATCNNGVCAVESSITITVNPLPAIPTISVNGASLTASSTSTGTYQWNLGGTAIGGATGANYTATASGSYTVTLTTAQGCSRTSTAVNISLTPPVANFSGTPTTVCAGNSVSFTDLTTNSPTSWAWNFGDGTTSTVQNPTHTYSTSGAKTVTLIATNAFGSDTEVKTNYITVQALPTGFTATANLTTICSGASVNLNMTGTFGGAYAWFVGGTQIATGMATTVSPTSTTTYRATCNNGVCAVESSITITVNPLPTTPTISVNGASLTASSTSAGTYQWNLGGTAIGGATGTNYTATASGSYTVTLTSAQGCSSTSAAANISLTPPVANFSGTPTTVCAGNSVSFTDLTTNSPTSWAWNFGDGTTSTVQNPTHTYSTSGTKTVTLIATNSFASDTETKTNYITVQALPTGFTATASQTTICSGASLNLDMTGTFGGAYAWFVDGTQIATGMTTTVSPTSTTTYTATCDNGVCAVESSITITVNSLPATPTISQDDETLTASSASSGTFQWYLNGSIIEGANNAVYVTTEDGDYTVTITDANGCVSSFSNTVVIASTAVFNNVLNASLTIYPNPVHEILSIEFVNSNFGEMNLIIVDVIGRTLKEMSVSGNKVDINLSNFASGVYLLRITNEEGNIAVRQIVKE